MTKRLIKNSIILLLLVAYMILYKWIVFPQFLRYSSFINASFFAFLFAASVLLLGFRKDKSTILFQNVIKYTVFYVLITGFTIYGIGFFVGFLKNAYSREFLTLIDNVFAPIVIFVLIELIRYVFIWANKDKKIFILIFTVLLIALELFFKVRVVNFGDFEATFRFASSTLLPTIIKNVFFSYLCYHVGYKVPMLYRLLVDVFYVYIVPIIPDLGEYLHAVIAITLPVVIYINIYEMIDSKCDKPRPLLSKKSFTLADVGFTVVLIAMVGLISGLLPVYMIGIGSSSMSPKINKGDAVIIQKIDENYNIQEGDIIAFSKKKSDKSVTVVHRVSKINNKDGVKEYITKGDANNSEDTSPVTMKQVKGIVRMRIPYVAYPTIYLNELIENWR